MKYVINANKYIVQAAPLMGIGKSRFMYEPDIIDWFLNLADNDIIIYNTPTPPLTININISHNKHRRYCSFSRLFFL